MSETVGVEYRVLAVAPIRGAGRLVALAIVEVTIADVSFTLQGIRVMLSRDGRTMNCEPPAFKNPKTGESVACIILPAELAAAISAEVLALVRAPPVPPGTPAAR